MDAGQIVVPRRHTRIDDGHRHARAVVAELLSRGRGSDGGAGTFHRCDDRAVHRDALDRELWERSVNDSVWDIGDLRVENRQLTAQRATDWLDERGDVAEHAGIAARTMTWERPVGDVDRLVQQRIQLVKSR